MAPTKKSTAKTAVPKKTAAAKAAKTTAKTGLTLDSLDARITQLEHNDIVAQGTKKAMSVRNFIKAKYEENPPLTIGVGVAILILLILIF